MIVGVGCDIVQIARIKKAMQNRAFLKVLTKEEIVLFEAVSQPRKAEWLAGRFAAKEAVIKAIASKKEMLLSQVSVLYEGKQPVCRIENYRVYISIAHEKEYACAYALVEEEVRL